MEKKPLFYSHVLYFVSNTKKNYYNVYMQLKELYNDKNSINVDDVDYFLNNLSVAPEDEKFYIKELPYQLEIYNIEDECIFCINKPHPNAKELNELYNKI